MGKISPKSHESGRICRWRCFGGVLGPVLTLAPRSYLQWRLPLCRGRSRLKEGCDRCQEQCRRDLVREGGCAAGCGWTGCQS